MATYAGYQGLNVPDLSAPFKEQVAGLMNQHAIERQREYEVAKAGLKLKKAEMNKIDKGYYTAMSKIAESGVTDYPDKTFQDVVFDATNQGRDQLKGYYDMLKKGQITSGQYKSIENNILSSFSALKEYNDNSAEFAQEQIKRMSEDKSGYLEKERAEYNAQLSNLSNKVAAFSDNGQLMWQTVDADGNVVSQQSLINLVSANNISNQLIDKIKVDEMVKQIAESSGGYTYTKGSKTITDPSAQEGYDGWVNNQIRTITNNGNPQTVTSILMDGGITSEFDIAGKKVFVSPGTFRSEQELKSKVDQEMMEIMEDYGLDLSEEDAKELRKEVTSMMIPITTEGGKDIYNINSKHKDLVTSRLKDDIKIKLGYKESKKSESTRNGSGKKTQLKSDLVRKIGDRAFNEASAEAFGDLDPNYMYVKSKGKVYIYKRQFTSEGVDITQKVMEAVNNGNDPSSVNVRVGNETVEFKPTDIATSGLGLADYAQSEATAQADYLYGTTVPGGAPSGGKPR